MWDQSMCFSSKVKDYDTFDTFLKFIDWMYTDEAAELTTFGLEGETFEVLPDGRKEYIDLTRITSYNVCYTKLLRKNILIHTIT